MAELRALLSSLGHDDVVTYIQSGNAVFDSPRAAAEVAAELEAGIEQAFGVRSRVMLRTQAGARRRRRRQSVPRTWRRPREALRRVPRERARAVGGGRTRPRPLAARRAGSARARGLPAAPERRRPDEADARLARAATRDAGDGPQLALGCEAGRARSSRLPVLIEPSLAGRGARPCHLRQRLRHWPRVDRGRPSGEAARAVAPGEHVGEAPLGERAEERPRVSFARVVAGLVIPQRKRATLARRAERGRVLRAARERLGARSTAASSGGCGAGSGSGAGWPVEAALQWPHGSARFSPK